MDNGVPQTWLKIGFFAHSVLSVVNPRFSVETRFIILFPLTTKKGLPIFVLSAVLFLFLKTPQRNHLDREIDHLDSCLGLYFSLDPDLLGYSQVVDYLDHRVRVAIVLSVGHLLG